MKRALFVSCRLPYPLDDGWKIRTFNILKGYALNGYEIDLVSFIKGSSDREICQPLFQLCNSITTVRRRGEYTTVNLLRGAIFPIPFSVLNYASREMRSVISKLTASHEYAVMQVEDIVMAQYLPQEKRFSAILDMHNVESELLLRYADDQRSLSHRWYAGMTARKLRCYERFAASRFDGIIVCSEEDRCLLKENTSASNVSVLPNGVDSDYFVPRNEEERNHLVFVGSMDYHANISGILYFAKKIFPIIQSHRSDVRLTIVGKNPPAEIKRLAGAKIEVTGPVADVRPYIAKATVVVVPLLVGGGTRLKILEAMAMGKAIVSTPIGCEGIGAVDGENIALAASPESFAECVLRLLEDERGRAHIGTLARNFALASYDWKVIRARLSALLQGYAAADSNRNLSEAIDDSISCFENRKSEGSTS